MEASPRENKGNQVRGAGKNLRGVKLRTERRIATRQNERTRPHHAPMKAMMKKAIDTRPTVVDLYSGAGLFSCAFRKENFRIIDAIEIDKIAASTYRRNLGDHVRVADVRNTNPSGRCDVLTAGVPCQGFSTLGKRDLQDPRNFLALEVVKWAKHLRPKVVDGMAIDCGFAMELMSSGAAVQCPNNDCGPRVMNSYDRNGYFLGRVLSQPFQAFADGYGSWVNPSGRPTTPPSLKPGAPRPGAGAANGNSDGLTGHDEGSTGNITGSIGATPQFLNAGFFEPQNTPIAIARKKNCATPNSIVELFKKELESQWERTTRSGEENGSLLFWERATNTYPRVPLSEGSHIRLGTTQYAPYIPAMPEIGPETRSAQDNFAAAGRTVDFLAFFHTHPNYPGGDSGSGDPSGDDIDYQSQHGNVLGIIRTGNGYSFFSNGRTFGANDPKANDCIWELNRARN